jgi:hypothetical protein
MWRTDRQTYISRQAPECRPPLLHGSNMLHSSPFVFSAPWLRLSECRLRTHMWPLTQKVLIHGLPCHLPPPATRCDVNHQYPALKTNSLQPVGSSLALISSWYGRVSSSFVQKRVSPAYLIPLVHFFKSIFKVLIQFSHLHLDLSSALFPLSFPTTCKVLVQYFTFRVIQQTKHKKCLSFIVSPYF